MKSVFALLMTGHQLKQQKRVGWEDKKHGRDVPKDLVESVADHTFNGVLLATAMTLDERRFPEIKRRRLIMLVVVHDLVEATDGDSNEHYHAATPEEVERLRAEKKRRERAAMSKISTQIGGSLGSEIRSLWREYDKGETREAKLAHDIDKVEAAAQAAFYYLAGYESDPLSFYQYAHTKVKNFQLRRLLEVCIRPLIPGA